MTRSFSNRLFGGVCGGLAASIPLNAWFWRFLFVLLTVLTGGAAAVVYLLLWWLMPLESPIRRGGGGIGGLLGLLLGLALIILYFAKGNLGIDTLYWPLALLVLAAVFLLKQVLSGAWENIALGLVALAVPIGFFLKETNALQAGYTDILLRAWPAVLIFLGLAIALRYRMRFGSWLALILSVALVAGLASFAFSSRVDVVRQENQLAISVPNEAAHELTAISPNITTLVVGVNSLDTDVTIAASTDSSRLITGNFSGSLNSDIELAYSEDASAPIATFVLTERQASAFPRLEDVGRGSLDLSVPSNIAVIVRFVGGTGSVNFDMGALMLEELSLSLQEGNVVVTLPSYQPLSRSVEQGNGEWLVSSGNLTVLVPDDLGVQFFLARGSNPEPRAGQNFDDLLFGLGLEPSDYVLRSRQFDSAEFRMSFRANVLGGTFQVDSRD
jgi:phage shock protein PspC (stress-responsive transcriptional regulator)